LNTLTSSTTSAFGTPTLTTNAINGLRAILFNGNSSLTGLTTGSGTTLTICIVGTQSNNCAVNGGLVCLGRSGFADNTDAGSLAITNSTPLGSGLIVSARTSVNSQIVNTGGTGLINGSSASPFVYILINDGTFVNTYLNGTLQTTENISRAGTFAYTNYVIGARAGSTTNVFYTGYIGEVIIFNSALTNTQLNQVQGYLGWKWKTNATMDLTNQFYYYPPIVRGFLPFDISIPEYWFDATDSTTIQLSGNFLTTWVNKGSLTNSNVTPTTANTSTSGITRINGNNLINIPITQRLQFTGSFPNLQRTRFIVTRQTSAGDVTYMFQGGTAASGNDYLGISTNGLVEIAQGIANRMLTSAIPAQTNLMSLLTFFNSSVATGNNRIALNGSNVTLTTSVVASSYNTGSITTFLGHTGGPGQDIGEFISFNQNLTLDEIYKIEGYLAWKWGLQSSLLSTHPYKILPPAVTLPFFPTNLTQCTLWLDGADRSPASMTFTGNTVNAWKDKSGNGYNFTQASYSTSLPPLSNLTTGTGVSFGSLQGLVNILYPFPTTYTIFCVANQTTNSATYQYILHSPYNADFTIFFGSSNGNFTTYAGSASAWNDTTANSPTSAIATTTNTASLLCCTNNGTSLIPYFNGTALTTKTGTNAIATGLILGDGSTASVRQPWLGIIGEIIIYNAVLTTGVRQKVEGYLAQKWRLQNLLPSTHPYKRFITPSQESLLIQTPSTIATVTLSGLSASTGTITWTTSTNAVGYYWYVGTTAGTPLKAGVVGAVLTTAVSFSFIVSTNYFAWVIPFSSTGKNGATTTSTAASYVPAPGQPTVNTPTNTTTTLNMTWNAPASGGTVTGYTVQVLANGTNAPSGLLTLGNVTSTTFSPMVSTTPYSFYVIATGPGGSGTQSATSTTVIYTAPPAAPTSVVLSALTGTGATVTWTAASGATSYNGQIYSSTVAGMTSPIAVGSSIVTITSPRAFTFTPTNGLYYGAIITAVNAGGSTASAISTGVLYSAAGPPVAPTTITLTITNNTTMSVTWSGGSGATSYNAQIYKSALSNMTSFSTVTATPASATSVTSPTSFTLSTYAAASYYYYAAIITAINVNGSTSSSMSTGVRYIPTFTAISLAGSTANALVTTNGTGAAASFNNLQSVVCDSTTNIYITEYGNLVRRVTTGGTVSAFTAVVLSFPVQIACDSTNTLYLCNSGTNGIRKVTTPGAVVTTVTGTFSNPKGCSVDNLGNLYVSQNNGQRVSKIVISSGATSILAGSGVAGFADGTTTAAQFNTPWGQACDQTGNIYVCDYQNKRIRKITPAGVVTTFAGNGTIGDTDGIGTAATFAFPVMICIDPQGLNLFVSDPKNGAFGNKIRQIVIATQQVITISGSGAVGTNNSTGLLSTYTSPYGLAMNRQGTILYVCDGGKVLRQLTL
jgi:hypothetical protein